jgi:tetratricopeptide (TPR) repeat protein
LIDGLREAAARAERLLESEASRPWLEAEVGTWRAMEDPLVVTASRLEGFLERTASVDVPRGERLRRLAIELESAVFEDGWDGLQRIYEAAAREAPEDARIFESWGISSTECFRWDDAPLEEQHRIFTDGERAFERALALAPDDADVAFHMGLHQYHYPKSERASSEHADLALPWFGRALALDPRHPMAQLYQAHCYHDKADWNAAVRAYAAVDQTRLLEERPYQGWRVVKLEEQLAFCLAEAGDLAEAKRRFLALIEEICRFTHDETIDWVVNLWDLEKAVETRFREDSDLVEAAARAVQHAYGRSTEQS